MVIFLRLAMVAYCLLPGVYVFSLPVFINICITHPFLRLKNANPAKQEQARLEVENAEDDLVQETEVAITLMKTVLENVSRICSLTVHLESDADAVVLQLKG